MFHTFIHTRYSLHLTKRIGNLEGWRNAGIQFQYAHSSMPVSEIDKKPNLEQQELVDALRSFFIDIIQYTYFV